MNLKVVDIIYTASSGVLIQVGASKVLIDALCHLREGSYLNTPESLAESMIASQKPFDQIQLMLYSHHHSDHFSSKYTHLFLQRHSETQLIAGTEVTDLLVKNAQNQHNDFSTIEKSGRINIINAENQSVALSDNLSVKAIKTIHMGKEYEDVEHYVFLIFVEGATILFLGDTEPKKENLSFLASADYNIDLVIAPFPYVSTRLGQRIITDMIKPKQIAVVHLPSPEKDTYHWFEAAQKMYDKNLAEMIPAQFLREIGHEYHFEI